MLHITYAQTQRIWGGRGHLLTPRVAAVFSRIVYRAESLVAVPSRRTMARLLTGLLLGLVGGLTLLMAAALLPGVFGNKPMVVVSGSMEPTLYGGDIAVVRRVEPYDLQVGDVITYSSIQGFVTHRIVGLDMTPQGPIFLLKGDANLSADPKPIPAEQIVGKVVYRVPRIGFLISITDSMVGRVLFIMVPLVLLVLMWVRARARRPNSAAQNGETPSGILELGRLQTLLTKMEAAFAGKVRGAVEVQDLVAEVPEQELADQESKVPVLTKMEAAFAGKVRGAVEVQDLVAEVPEQELVDQESEEPVQEQEVREAAPERSDPIPAETVVQLIMPPPVAPNGLSQLYRRLDSAKGAEILETSGTSEGGVSVKLVLREALPLLQILKQLPEVATAQNLSGEQGGEDSGLRRILLVLKSPLELTQNQVAVAKGWSLTYG